MTSPFPSPRRRNFLLRVFYFPLDRQPLFSAKNRMIEAQDDHLSHFIPFGAIKRMSRSHWTGPKEVHTMMFQFFWSRTASAWIAILYIALGLPLILFPEVSGSLFVWALAAGAVLYAVSHLWRYIQGRKGGHASSGDLFLTILPLAFALFAFFWPDVILSFLPLVLGAFLLVDSVGKLPLVLTAITAKHPTLLPLLFASLVPLVLGVLLIVNPFHAAHIVIMVFGGALIADGVSDLMTAVAAQKTAPIPSSDSDGSV